ncbi:MAG TPA: hypothetical protein VMP12_12380 [Candidatus Sulfotelmatobacter sp.]|nr:hypothetical protein [Candidatus Sulfotelmatobacter sp.]
MKKISKKPVRELAALARMPDSEIDLTDAPDANQPTVTRSDGIEAAAPGLTKRRMLAELQRVVYMHVQTAGR